MKLNNLILILYLIFSIKAKNILENFMIETFIEHVKQKGFLEIIKSIKEIYGQDVAII